MAECKLFQDSLAWCQGTPELPGIKRRIYYIAKQSVVKWPVLNKSAQSVNPAGPVYDGNFELAADSKWKFIDVLPDKCQLTSEPQGEIPSQTQLNKLSAVHPGVGISATAAAAFINNCDNVFLVEDMNGQFRVVGNDKWMTKSAVAQDLGQGPTGVASTTITAEATDLFPAPFYPGKIETDAGTIMGDGSNPPGA